jgi:hypothetical protein
MSLANWGPGNVTANLFAVPNGSSASTTNQIFYSLLLQSGDTYQIYAANEKLLLGPGDFIQVDAGPHCFIANLTNDLAKEEYSIFDIDDVILNGFGVMVGYWMYVLFQKVMSSEFRRLAILSISVLSLVIIISVIVFVKQNEIGFETLHERNQIDRLGKSDGDSKQVIDPCNGTEGTGQIISIAENTITIKRRDGKEEVVVLTEKTSYSNSAGPTIKSILKVRDRVTVVIDDSNTAMAVLVCGIQ